MRYKALLFIEVSDGHGWDAQGIEDALTEELNHMGDITVNCFVVEEPAGCDVNPASSRVCEMGTKSCDTPHSQCRWCRGKGHREFDRGEEVRGCIDCKGTGRAQ